MGKKQRNFLAIDKCPSHGYYAISINNDIGGTRLTDSKCCGTWSTLRQWEISDDDIRRIISQLEEYLSKKVAH